ncbi:hypothetical protein NDU88_012318, partial [Pleurodeles waltl]
LVSQTHQILLYYFFAIQTIVKLQIKARFQHIHLFPTIYPRPLFFPNMHPISLNTPTGATQCAWVLAVMFNLPGGSWGCPKCHVVLLIPLQSSSNTNTSLLAHVLTSLFHHAHVLT